MYVDDRNVYVSVDKLTASTEIIRLTYTGIIKPWCHKVGPSLDFDKREICHFTQRKGEQVFPSITFHDNNSVPHIVAPQSSVKWLGVHFNSKLTFNHHVKQLTNNAGKAVGSLQMLANTVCGLSQYHTRQMYKACIVPAMTYASPVWWTGKKLHEKQLEKIQNRGLRLICTVFCTTTIAALEIKASIPPIRIELDQLNRSCVL